MRDLFKPSILLKVLLPLVIMVAIGLSPRPLVVDMALQQGGAENDAAGINLARPFEQAAQAMPWRGDLWERAGQEALQAGNYAAAIQSFQKAGSLGKLSVPGQRSLGEAYAAQDNLSAAIEVWDGLVGAGNSSADLSEKLAQAHLNLGDLPAAIDDLRKGAVAFPQNASLVFQYGLFSSLVNPQEGLRMLLVAEKLDPQQSAAVKSLQAGINLALIEQDPAYRYLVIGRALGSIDEWNLAYQAFRMATQSNPDYAEAWAFQGEAEQHLNGDGFPDLNRALGLNPNSVLVQALVAMYWQRQGKADLALVNLHTAANLEPKNPVWQVALGEAVASLGDVNEAITYYQQATTLAPQDPKYWRLLAVFSAQNMVQLTEAGLPAARQAMVLAANDPASLDTMGQVFLALDDLSSAERFFSRALQASPDYIQADLHLAMTYLRGGKTSEAYPLLVKAAGAQIDLTTSQLAHRLLKMYYP